MSYPILITSYTAGTVFKLDVYYIFPVDHPKKDYTVRLYSKQNINVYDADGETNMLHMDGTSPSGFDGETDPTEPTEPTTPTDTDENPWASEGIEASESIF
mmetsp:Transcript_1826/g.2454  ORF Transcript_1826/g.2454 Transcript_1826/m.2454 type:complete len:101 (+) Transcript_1826:1485-1787(+)